MVKKGTMIIPEDENHHLSSNFFNKKTHFFTVKTLIFQSSKSPLFPTKMDEVKKEISKSNIFISLTFVVDIDRNNGM